MCHARRSTLYNTRVVLFANHKSRSFYFGSGIWTENEDWTLCFDDCAWHANISVGTTSAFNGRVKLKEDARSNEALLYEKERALISHCAIMIYEVTKLMNVLEPPFCDSFLNPFFISHTYLFMKIIEIIFIFIFIDYVLIS